MNNHQVLSHNRIPEFVIYWYIGRFGTAELRHLRDTSHCYALWVLHLLVNEELSAPGLDLLVPDISKPCVMFFPWTSTSNSAQTTLEKNWCGGTLPCRSESEIES